MSVTPGRRWSARRYAAHYAADWGRRAREAIARAHAMHGPEAADVFANIAAQCARFAWQWARVVVELDGQAAACHARAPSKNQTAGGSVAHPAEPAADAAPRATPEAVQ